MYTVEQIAEATGAPLHNCQIQWPLLVAALGERGIEGDLVLIAAAATVATETGSFLPIPEWGSGAEYEGRSDLGNVYPGDGPRYKGRGLLQLTGRANYRYYGGRIGVDLEGNPDLALQTDVSAKVFALYFLERGCAASANASDWYAVRREVNGGLNGIDTFMAVVNRMLGMPTSHPVPVARVSAQDWLQQTPVLTGPHAFDAKRQPIKLKVGQVVQFTPDPSPGTYHKQETTPHWAHVVADIGTQHTHGWYLREKLRTTGG